MLIVFSGLPGTGKTTLARAVAQERSATYLRIDTIEQALTSSGVLPGDVGPAGYLIAYAVAEANLGVERAVVADAVNPIRVARDSWRDIALETGCPLFEIEVICSNVEEHRRRVETRESDIGDLVLPTWRQVVERGYEPWDRQHFVIDTAERDASACLDEIRAWIDGRSGESR